ncbi:L-glyceraldehyde 3-phosphate reductase [Roseibium algae]|uniref:L-glyceraldehyde 3-phosphate reductase n=1 Tax=Roseibium algae TaxID=3123038 RepID=A0ABU8TRG9_9HYPH
MTYNPAPTRYDSMIYNRSGLSGLKLSALSLGLWHNFGGDTPRETGRTLCRTAFDHGITHFDLANNYGPPPGSAEEAFGDILKTDFLGLRDEMVISTKAGYRMWPGPYGEWGSRKYLLSSLDQSLKRMGLDYVDIFYSHRVDPETPLEETMGALDSAVRQGKALYVGISSYNSERTREAARILKDLGTPCIIHQPSYSMINRWVEDDGLLDTLNHTGIGSIAFTPLAQGVLTGKYLKGVPEDSRAAAGKSLKEDMITEDKIKRIRSLASIAESRGQSLAQMAIAWVLREGRVTSALIGASRPEQITDCIGSLQNLTFSNQELTEIDGLTKDFDVNLWAQSSNA